MKNARCSRCIQNDGVLCFVFIFGLEENLNFNKLVPNFEGYGQESARSILVDLNLVVLELIGLSFADQNT